MFAWLTIAILGALVLGALAMFHYLKSRGETADAVRWANRAAPLIFEQSAQGTYFAQTTIEQYKTALALLKKHGNKLLEKEDIYLWIHNADAENARLDFEAWQNENVIRRQRIIEDFNLKKAAQAAKKQMLIHRAQMLTTEKLPLEKRDFERNQNGTHE